MSTMTRASRHERPARSSQQTREAMIVQLIDAYSFDVRSVKKTCVHIVHTDGRLIPFDTDNLFYRDELETTRLAPLRARSAGIADLTHPLSFPVRMRS